MDTTHLVALEQHLSREKQRLLEAKTAHEKEMRAVWVKQLEKEIEGEKTFLGIKDEPLPELSDEELLQELLG